MYNEHATIVLIFIKTSIVHDRDMLTSGGSALG